MFSVEKQFVIKNKVIKSFKKFKKCAISTEMNVICVALKQRHS
jgi:hypothetical protein